MAAIAGDLDDFRTFAYDFGVVDEVKQHIVHRASKRQMLFCPGCDLLPGGERQHDEKVDVRERFAGHRCRSRHQFA